MDLVQQEDGDRNMKTYVVVIAMGNEFKYRTKSIDAAIGMFFDEHPLYSGPFEASFRCY